MSRLLEFDDVYKSFGEEEVLQGVSFGMDRTDVEVVVGPSGSGKSTLLRCVNQLTDIDDGAIYFVLTFATNRTLDRIEERYAVPTGESS